MTSDAVYVLLDAARVRELMSVVKALDDIGAAPLVFKGAALAHTHYGESWLRPRADSDLLIPTRFRRQVSELLNGLGYDWRPSVAGDLVTYQATFVRIDNLHIEHRLDVHWRIANPQVVSQIFTHDELVARALTIPVAGHSMRVPSSVDALLLACLHRAAHHDDSEDPVWLQDIHLIASRLEPAEWSTVVERASHSEVKAICARGLRLAIDHCSTQVPAAVMERLSVDPTRPERSAVYLRKDLRPVDRLAADVRALGPKRAAHLIREHLFPPAEYIEAKYGVRNRALLPAYYALRVMQGASKWLARAAN